MRTRKKQSELVVERLQWFVDRIGQTLFRFKTDCDCAACQNVYSNGVLVKDKDHAYAIYTYEMELGIKYYDTILERDLSETKKRR